MSTNLENLKLRKDQIKSKYARDIEQINRQIQAAEDEEKRKKAQQIMQEHQSPFARLNKRLEKFLKEIQ